MKVWIEQSYCTGDGLCQELCPDIFELGDDGLAHLKQGQAVPNGLEDSVLDARAECPGECIYIEV